MLYHQIYFVLLHVGFNKLNTVGPRFATVRITTIPFYDPCPVGPALPTCGASLSQLKRPFSI